MSDINAILDRHGIKRCGDSSCIFGPRGGMMTNGGCRCGHDDPGAPSRPTRLSRQLAHAVTEQAAEIARLTADLAAARAVTAGVCRYLDCSESDLLAVVTSLYESRARAISDATAARGTVGGLLATAPECPTWCATHDPRDMATAMDGDRRYASPECRDAGRCLTRGPLPKGG